MSFLRFNQESLLFFPEVLPQDYTFSFSQPFEEVFLETSDQARIHALHFRREQPKGVVLFFHGNAGSLRSWGQLANDFLDRGYSVLMPDYRTYGKSTGKLSEEALHADAQLMWAYLLQIHAPEEVVIFGRSIGTGLAVPLAAKNQPGLLVLETPFLHLAELAKHHYPFLPISLLLQYHFRSDQHIGQVRCPVFILHGTHDTIIPYESGQALAARVQSPLTFFTVPEGGHNDLASFTVYQQALDQILGPRKQR